MSSGWSWYVNALVVLNIVGCTALLWWTSRGGKAVGQGQRGRSRHRPCLGWRPARVRQAAAALVDQPVLPDDRVQHRLPGVVSGHGQLQGRQQLDFGGQARCGPRRQRRETGRYVPALRRQGHRCAGARPAGRGAGPRAVRQSLRHLPRFFGHRAPSAIRTSPTRSGNGAATPDDILHTVLNGRNAQMPAWETTLTGMGGESAVDDVATYVLSLTDPSLVATGDEAVARGRKLFASVCAACHGPEGQGQCAAGRAGPDGRLLAVWPQPRRRARRPAPGAQRHDAGARAAHRRNPRAPGRGLCVVVVACAGTAPVNAHGPTPTFDHPLRPLPQRLGAILWPSFFAAGIATMVCFAFVDPLDPARPDVPRPAADAASWATRSASSCSGSPPRPPACSPGYCCARRAASIIRCDGNERLRQRSRRSIRAASAAGTRSCAMAPHSGCWACTTCSRGCTGTAARPCCSTCRRASSTSSA